jgi:Transposase DDE domain group 1
MKIYFHGATVGVTRSAYHVVTKHASVLVDCGMFQGRKQEAAKNRALHFKLDDLLPLVEAEAVTRIVGQIRQSWPEVKIILRADSGFCRDDLMSWCEVHASGCKRPRTDTAVGDWHASLRS